MTNFDRRVIFGGIYCCIFLLCRIQDRPDTSMWKEILHPTLLAVIVIGWAFMLERRDAALRQSRQEDKS